MKFRLATFNVENMFQRPAVMNLPSWNDGKSVLQDYSRLLELIDKPEYKKKDKEEMISIMKRHDKLITKKKSDYLILNEINGKLLKRKNKIPQIVANGRNDWIGWFVLRRESINDATIENTARVINEVNADIIGLVEVENRIVLTKFNDSVIPNIGGEKYDHLMLIDGNDDRGIDVGIVTRKPYTIDSIVSHIDDTDETGIIFSRDCPEYRIKISSEKTLLVMVNHFKSKGFGSQESSNKKRKRQAKQVAKIYKERLDQGFEHIAILGDLNDTPKSDPLSPLLGSELDLTDVMTLDKFESDGRVGTHANGTKSGKLDYILLSPELVKLVDRAGIERRGVWGGKHGTLFPHFPEIKNEMEAASDHASLWVDLEI